MRQSIKLTALLLSGCLLAAGSALAVDDAPVDAQRIAEGRALAFAQPRGNCLACHQIADGELPGDVGPPLDNMRARYPDRELLFKRIWDEAQFNPATVMPPFGRNLILDRDEIEKIIDFLYTQ